MVARRLLSGLLLLTLVACAGGGNALPAGSADAVTAAAAARESAAVPPFTPGLGPEPDIAAVPAGVRSAPQTAAEARFAAELGDPERSVLRARTPGAAAARTPRNVVAGGNGEAVGLITSPTFSANGGTVTIGVQLYYIVEVGGNFFHTHQFVNNECFEYGINYSAAPPTLYAYDWCSGGNTSPGWMNRGLVGDPGGVLNTWSANGFGSFFHWDPIHRTQQITLEEIYRASGWHLLGYDYVKQRWVDLMSGYGVTGTKNACCGWAEFENHVANGATCRFDSHFPLGAQLLSDTDMRVLIGNRWESLNTVPNGGFSDQTETDCANISGNPNPNYRSPYFSGGYIPPSDGSHPGDWWLIQQ